MATDIVHYTSCPVCGSLSISRKMLIKDHSISKQDFEVFECADCTLRFTQDIPSAEKIGPYYKSENYISHTNTSKGFVNRVYHIVRNFTLSGKKKLISNVTKLGNGALLDIGAGAGAFASFMQSKGWKVTGLEPDDDTRAIAKKDFGIDLRPIGDLYTLAEQYDAITMWHVLEHIHTLHQYLEQIKKLLKPGGAVFIAVPNYTSYDASKYQDYWAAYDVPRHLYHFSPDSIRKLISLHGLKLEAIKPMWFDSVYVSLLSEKYLKGESKLLPAFFTGMRSNLKAVSDKERASSLIYVLRHS